MVFPLRRTTSIARTCAHGNVRRRNPGGRSSVTPLASALSTGARPSQSPKQACGDQPSQQCETDQDPIWPNDRPDGEHDDGRQRPHQRVRRPAIDQRRRRRGGGRTRWREGHRVRVGGRCLGRQWRRLDHLWAQPRHHPRRRGPQRITDLQGAVSHPIRPSLPVPPPTIVSPPRIRVPTRPDTSTQSSSFPCRSVRMSGQAERHIGVDKCRQGMWHGPMGALAQ